ncbi:MAG: hypothetical protein LUD27_08060 [Clostridia bacterium]|nr:hypothetical protein [Clostridia bacterium]
MKNSKKLYVYIATICISAGLILFIPMVMGYLLSFIVAAIADALFLLIIGFIFRDLKLIIYSVITSVVALILLLLLLYSDIPESVDYILMIATCAIGFALLVTGVIFFLINLCHANKQKKIEKQTGAPASDLIYPLSPKSITAENLQNFGVAYYDKLKANSKFLIGVAIAAAVCFIIGTVILCALTAPIKFIGLVWYIIGLVFILFAYNILRNKKHYTESTIEQLGQEMLNKYFEQQKTSFNRAIDIPYYSECQELKSINFTPSVYARGGNFEAIEAADVIFDESGGAFAVCTTYSNETLLPFNIFEMSKVLAVSLCK